MRSIDDILTPPILEYIRWMIAIAVTIAAGFVFYTSWLELNNPGTTNGSIYITWAYRFIWITVILAVPLWYVKGMALKKYFTKLDTIYGDDTNAKDRAVSQAIATKIQAHSKEIVFTAIIAVILYFAVSNYIFTPDVVQGYQNHFNVDYYNITNYTIVSDNSTNYTAGGSP